MGVSWQLIYHDYTLPHAATATSLSPRSTPPHDTHVAHTVLMIRLASSEIESGLIVQRSAPHTVNPSQYGYRALQGAYLKSSWPYAVASTSAKRGPAPGVGGKNSYGLARGYSISFPHARSDARQQNGSLECGSIGCYAKATVCVIICLLLHERVYSL